MEQAGGDEFHLCLLRFFRLHVRLFLNSLTLTVSFARRRWTGGRGLMMILTGGRG